MPQVYHSTPLPCPALHSTALPCTALHCTALHCTALLLLLHTPRPAVLFPSFCGRFLERLPAMLCNHLPQLPAGLGFAGSARQMFRHYGFAWSCRLPGKRLKASSVTVAARVWLAGTLAMLAPWHPQTASSSPTGADWAERVNIHVLIRTGPCLARVAASVCRLYLCSLSLQVTARELL
ncbi:hypothetical protein DM02DRAFT_87033 [Periconia macrospinosa]|uniref:Uncharacterized protein n=1 Tax=Periconia macrospinosa TaxID=97972 RepID=A0A2V1DH60_9PLEO|nr:hypothetical protein DM02DRAFT_87033 [Periconia macrospinosa]